MKKNYILISGGVGYLGKNLIKHLINLKYDIINIDLKKNPFNHKNLINIKLNMTNYDQIYEKLKKYNISYIFHFAAISDIDFSVSNPKKTLNNNIFSTYNLLKIGKKKNIQKFIFASSIYTNSIQGSFYRISKICCEEIIEEFKRLHNFDYTIIRYGSLFGDLNFSNTINNIIKFGLSGKIINRDGFGDEIRNYISIDDAVKLTIKLLNKNQNRKYYNITGCEKINFKKIIQIIKKEIPNLNIIYSKTTNENHYIRSPYNKSERKFYDLTVNKKNYFETEIKTYINKFKEEIK